MTTDEHVKSEFLFEETKRELLLNNFFSKRGSICFNSSIFFARDMSNYILAGNFEENFF